MFTIKFETNNDAFADDPQTEICRILGVIQKSLMNNGSGGHVKDVNGNKIGQWDYTPDDYFINGGE